MSSVTAVASHSSPASPGRCRPKWSRLVVLGLAGVACLAAPPAVRAGPPPISFADIVEKVAPAVVNIATTKEIQRGETPDLPFPQPPPGSPFEDFFREFFNRDRPPEQMLHDVEDVVGSSRALTDALTELAPLEQAVQRLGQGG